MLRAKLLFALVLVAASCAEPSDQGLNEGEGGDRGTDAGLAGKDGGGKSGTGGGTGTGGTAGKGGSGGVQADGGAGKDGGRAGTSGTAGTNGAAGTAGTGGAAGTQGTGGVAGTGGSAGTSGTAGTGGTGGAAGVGGGATGGSGGAPPTGFAVQYRVEETGASVTAIGSQLFIVNNGSSTVNLNELKLRYYLTSEVTQQIMQRINWGNLATISGGAQTQIQAEITITPPTALPTPAAGADSYVEFGFSSSRTLPPGQRVQFSWTVHNNASQRFNQTDDYSFNATMTNPANWDKVVLTQGQTVLWGVAP